MINVNNYLDWVRYIAKYLPIVEPIKIKPPPKPPEYHKLNGEREKARRRRQIERGMLNESNGLVR